MTAEELALLICRSLRSARSIEIDGLGVFTRDASGKICLRDGNRPRIFIAYAVEDFALAEKLYYRLEASGYSPWLDRRRLLPGQDWPRRIQDAIESSDFFIACFSHTSATKRGAFQSEIRCALECAGRMPLDDVFLIPIRLDDCRVPLRIRRETQYVDLFPDWETGFERVRTMIERQRREVA